MLESVRLHAAVVPDDMNLPGLRLHPLKGGAKGGFAVSLSGNWRITFGFSENNAIDVDYEDYGRPLARRETAQGSASDASGCLVVAARTRRQHPRRVRRPAPIPRQDPFGEVGKGKRSMIGHE